MRSSMLMAASAAVALSWGMPASGDVTNPGFEGGLTGWTPVGTVFATNAELSRDFLGLPQPPASGFWTPQEGLLFASLWSTDSGGTDVSMLSQSFAGDAGSVLSFDYFFDFGDFAAFPDTATAELSWSTGALTLFEHNTPGHLLGDDENIGWTPVSTILPVTDTYTLKFTTADGPGVFESILGVDNVHIQPIPAPGALLLGAVGLGMVGWFKHRLA